MASDKTWSAKKVWMNKYHIIYYIIYVIGCIEEVQGSDTVKILFCHNGKKDDCP